MKDICMSLGKGLIDFDDKFVDVKQRLGDSF